MQRRGAAHGWEATPLPDATKPKQPNAAAPLCGHPPHHHHTNGGRASRPKPKRSGAALCGHPPHPHTNETAGRARLEQLERLGAELGRDRRPHLAAAGAREQHVPERLEIDRDGASVSPQEWVASPRESVTSHALATHRGAFHPRRRCGVLGNRRWHAATHLHCTLPVRRVEQRVRPAVVHRRRVGDLHRRQHKVRLNVKGKTTTTTRARARARRAK